MNVACLYCGRRQAPIESCAGCGAPFPWPEPHDGVWPGDRLFDAQGRAVAVVDHVARHRSQIEVTTHNDTTERYVLGVLRVTLTAHVL